jgi:hypothetical protein
LAKPTPNSDFKALVSNSNNQGRYKVNDFRSESCCPVKASNPSRPYFLPLSSLENAKEFSNVNEQVNDGYDLPFTNFLDIVNALYIICCRPSSPSLSLPSLSHFLSFSPDFASWPASPLSRLFAFFHPYHPLKRLRHAERCIIKRPLNVKKRLPSGIAERQGIAQTRFLLAISQGGGTFVLVMVSVFVPLH